MVDTWADYTVLTYSKRSWPRPSTRLKASQLRRRLGSDAP